MHVGWEAGTFRKGCHTGETGRTEEGGGTYRTVKVVL